MEIIMYIFQLVIIIFGLLCAFDIIKINNDYNKNYSITEACPHDIAEIRVIETTVTCETTVLFCSECNAQLSKPKIECR